MVPTSNRGSFRRVLVAIDDSHRADDVFATAVDIARSSHGALRLFYAVAVPPEFPPAAATGSGDPLPSYLRKMASERLHALAATATDVPCDIVIEESHRPSQAILDAADAYDADLIVIGSHRYSIFERVLGTTSAKVVNTSMRDVFVVHRRRSDLQT